MMGDFIAGLDWGEYVHWMGMELTGAFFFGLLLALLIRAWQRISD